MLCMYQQNESIFSTTYTFKVIHAVAIGELLSMEKEDSHRKLLVITTLNSYMLSINRTSRRVVIQSYQK